MTSGKSSQQYLLKVFLSELFLNRTFALIRLNGGSGPSLLRRCSLFGDHATTDPMAAKSPKQSMLHGALMSA